MCVCQIGLPGRVTEATRPRLAGAFQLYDIDGDGFITYAEMLQIVQSIYKMTGQMVKLPPDEDTPEKVRARPASMTTVARRLNTVRSTARRQDLQEHGPGQGREADIRRVRRGQQARSYHRAGA